jgi:hypothetical protein
MLHRRPSAPSGARVAAPLSLAQLTTVCGGKLYVPLGGDVTAPGNEIAVVGTTTRTTRP